MQCPRCRAENREGARFCRECEARFDGVCPKCGAKVEPGSKFCDACGSSIPVAVTATTLPSRFASPEIYTPKHLAEKILSSRSELEGERKLVTVLFADLKGSMGILADRDPEEARKLLDPVLERMMEAVHRYEGTVNQVMGDGIVALFGAPVAHEDHAVRACYAALRMQEAVKRYAGEIQRSHGVPVQIRVGLNAGEVVVRSIGSDLHMDYTAVGQTTHLAARLEQMAVPGSILISADTMALAEGYAQIKPLGPMAITGLDTPMEVYELLGVLPMRSRMEAAAARGLTPFVGRQREVEALRHALARVQAGHGQVVGVLGEPGVGKTRLFYEFTHSHHTQGWLLLETGSMSYGKATAYLPVLDLLKGYFHIETRDDARRMREKVTGKLLTLGPALQPSLPAFLALLDILGEDPQWEALDPPQRRQRTLDALKRLVLRQSQVQPVCLVVENLHWIDAETQAWLDSLIECLPTARLLLLVNFRPEYQHGWGERKCYTQLRLDPLPPKSAEDLLQARLGPDHTLQPLKRLLIERTEGNPFFLEESVRTLVETEVLTGARGAYRLATALPSIQVPPTVQAVLAARIDRLPLEEKRLLQAAAVVGKDVPYPLLQAIAELPEEVLRQGLTHLQAAEFLYEISLFPDLEYTFKHALTSQVAYGSLLLERRRALHARIVEAIERLYPDRLAEQVDRLAHHAFRGEVWEKAAIYLRQAGARAAARSAHREAVGLFEGALTVFRHLPETRQTLEDAIDLRFDLRASLAPLGEHERVFEYLREAERLCESLDDPRRLGRVYDYMSYYFFLTGRLADARTLGQRAHAIAERVGDLPLQVTANLGLGMASVASGDYVEGEGFFRGVVQLLAGDLSHERFGQAGFPAVLSRSWLARSLAERGEFCEGITHGQEGVRIAEAIAQPYSLIAACWRLGYLYGVKAEYPQAIRLLERGLALSCEWNIPLYAPAVSSTLGHVYALSGRVPEGLLLLEQASTTYEDMGVRGLDSLGAARLGEAYLLADRVEDARACVDRALMVARARGARGDEAYALRLLGEITSRGNSPDPETADTYYQQAMTLGEELGIRPLVAHCHLGLGRLYLRTGKRQRAQEHLAAAMRMFHEMDMGFWLERAEAEVKGLG
ncbi:MAG TPA: adenylate/guanylate cyclase domain-containing protein [Candidatus Methylomirabilis sp.]|nr:adenylate/guanylate cyclase domain-containing protein [Candidatus Methylomirabilis sp.]